LATAAAPAIGWPTINTHRTPDVKGCSEAAETEDLRPNRINTPYRPAPNRSRRLSFKTLERESSCASQKFSCPVRLPSNLYQQKFTQTQPYSQSR
jgi:hypothetical protein